MVKKKRFNRPENYLSTPEIKRMVRRLAKHYECSMGAMHRRMIKEAYAKVFGS